MIGYHYCKNEIFEAILESKSLWLTNLTQSNDAQEVICLYQTIWSKIKKDLQNSDLDQSQLKDVLHVLQPTLDLQSEIDIPFGCCFTKEGDVVNMWNEYGAKGEGVSIGFSLDDIPLITKQRPITSTDFNSAIGYESVVYNSDELSLNLSQTFYNAIRKFGPSAWYLRILPTMKQLAAFIKNHTFKYENEIRIVFYPDDRLIKNSPLGSLVVDPSPHYCLPLSRTGALPIKRIIIGYTNKMSASDITVLLNKYGINSNPEICVSACSYKDRNA